MKVPKLHRMISQRQSPRQNGGFAHTRRKLKNNLNSPAVRHFTRKPELVPNILQAIVDSNGSDLSIRTSYDLNLEAALKENRYHDIS